MGSIFGFVAAKINDRRPSNCNAWNVMDFCSTVTMPIIHQKSLLDSTDVASFFANKQIHQLSLRYIVWRRNHGCRLTDSLSAAFDRTLESSLMGSVPQ